MRTYFPKTSANASFFFSGHLFSAKYVFSGFELSSLGHFRVGFVQFRTDLTEMMMKQARNAFPGAGAISSLHRRTLFKQLLVNNFVNNL